MNRQRVLIGAAVVLCLSLTGAALLFPLGNHRVGPRSFAQLRPGMNEEEIRAVLGEPVSNASMSWGLIRAGQTHRVRCWFSDRYTIAVAFDWSSGQAADLCLVDELPLKLQPTIWDTLRLWLGL